MVRPVKAFDAVLNAVVMQLQRTQGAKVKLTLEIEAVADEGLRLTGTKNTITKGIIQPIIAIIEKSVLQVQFQIMQNPQKVK